MLKTILQFFYARYFLVSWRESYSEPDYKNRADSLSGSLLYPPPPSFVIVYERRFMGTKRLFAWRGYGERWRDNRGRVAGFTTRLILQKFLRGILSGHYDPVQGDRGSIRRSRYNAEEIQAGQMRGRRGEDNPLPATAAVYNEGVNNG